MSLRLVVSLEILPFSVCSHSFFNDLDYLLLPLHTIVSKDISSLCVLLRGRLVDLLTCICRMFHIVLRIHSTVTLDKSNALAIPLETVPVLLIPIICHLKTSEIGLGMIVVDQKPDKTI